MSELKFATRLNSFSSGAHLYWPDLQGKPSVLQMIARAGTAKGLTHLDLNYPQHITSDISTMRQAIADAGLAVNGMQMRWDAPQFKIGAFTNPEAKIRREAIELTKRGIYGGACGYLSFGGEMDLAIAIRTGVIKDGTLYVQAAAGIVADSVPEMEWQETENKARAVLRAAEQVQDGLDGEI